MQLYRGLKQQIYKNEAKKIVDDNRKISITEFHFQSGSIVYAWDSVDVTADEISQTRDSSGRVLHQARTVTGLEPDTAYVAKIKVSNLCVAITTILQ